MSTPDPATAHRKPAAAKSGLIGVASIIGALSLLAIAVSLFSLASETKYGNCVDAQVAKYPPVGVSAFNTKSTGPIKVAYDAERRKAVEAC